MSFDSSRSFLMSQRAADQGRNMHVFSLSCFPQARMAGGFNLNRIHLTAKTFYRWLYLCDEIINYQQGINDAVVLRKIRLRTVDVLFYAVEEIEGPPIPRDSLQLIEPGIYGIFSADGTPFTRYFCSPVRFHPSFKDQEVLLVQRSHGHYKGENDIPMDLRVLAGARDKGRCFITGRTDLPTQCVWILPPLATFNRDHSDPTAFDKYKVIDNLITICSALADPFMRNLFAVDVEDNARIITFEDLPERFAHVALASTHSAFPLDNGLLEVRFHIYIGYILPRRRSQRRL
ncbi:hypothetical protein MIND_01301300 [Mycena indigotica]|uniref:Uncharacterized protein n=1 Tax=Mycena indigotica TaxID=2126181 RepID=A0A8H6VSR9_9AGAR|nr:uncharacterized protein MIND_01301300 [Mycena indigotica]KAF7290611.1 hypothetical protein MIND_01301300 [Mycena indigotica]